MRTLTISAYLLTLLMGASLQVPAATLEQQLESEYKLTTPTADNSDIVTMGFHSDPPKERLLGRIGFEQCRDPKYL